MTQDEFKNIICLAIDREVEVYTFYRTVSDKVKDKSLKDMFNGLAEDEQKHRAEAPEKMHFSESKDYKIMDELPTPPLTLDLKPLEGLVIATKKELEAKQMYTQLAKSSTDAARKNIFVELASMERRHKSKLEDLYTNMAFPEIWERDGEGHFEIRSVI